MTECERLTVCAFFKEKMNAMPLSADLTKQHFCLGSYVECARYRVWKAGLEVPIDLYPHDAEAGDRMLSRRQVS